MSEFKPTEEQLKVMFFAKKGANILVDSCAGSGKTTTIQFICDMLKDKSILYLTFNTILKVDAQKRIKNKNVKVQNYHGFASMCLYREGYSVSYKDIMVTFNKAKPSVPNYDVLIIDEYQDIDSDIIEMLNYVKKCNEGIQIIAVGDMAQKIYDLSSADSLVITNFMDNYLGDYEKLYLTESFRLSKEYAEKVSKTWGKTIKGINPNCKVRTMNIKEVYNFLKNADVKDILCLGSTQGDMSKVLNYVEEYYPEKYNKNTVYASIVATGDNQNVLKTHDIDDIALFTTFDKCKGLERKICLVFDYTDAYWTVRLRKGGVRPDILRNLFCVASTRGKEQIIFVKGKQALLDNETVVNAVKSNTICSRFEHMIIGDMFNYQYEENIRMCYNLLDVTPIDMGEDINMLDVKLSDGLIDLSPCYTHYQKAIYFTNYALENHINMLNKVFEDKGLNKIDNSYAYVGTEKAILRIVSAETRQNRYMTQVVVPYVKQNIVDSIKSRLGRLFKEDEENVQIPCDFKFHDEKGKEILSVSGLTDVMTEQGDPYILIFNSEVSRVNCLVCAMHCIAQGKETGYVWNTMNNSCVEVKIPNDKKQAFLDAVITTVTKGIYNKYYDGKSVVKAKPEKKKTLFDLK